MTLAKFITADYRRALAKSPDLILENRYFENNPSLNEGGASLLARPGMRKAMEVGNGPIRAIYSQPGAFDESLFVVSGLDLYQVTSLGVSTNLGEIGTLTSNSVSMAVTGTIGDTIPNYLFIADGGILWMFTDNGFALGQLSATGAISNTETVTLGTMVYKFTTGSVDTGTPAGTLANPWLVKIGATDSLSVANLAKAIADIGESGVDYSTALTPNVEATLSNYTSTAIFVRAIEPGATGNAIATTETGANLAWGGATLASGGDPSLVQVPLPGGVGCISVAHINSYIIAVPAQGENVNGRFYWVQPGETTINALDYATAERSPDAILQVKVFSDQIIFAGQDTTENWITTGNPEAPFQRFQGILFDRGIWEGTAVQIKESLITVDPNGQVLQISGGIKTISNPSIEERIRRAITLEGF